MGRGGTHQPVITHRRAHVGLALVFLIAAKRYCQLAGLRTEFRAPLTSGLRPGCKCPRKCDGDVHATNTGVGAPPLDDPSNSIVAEVDEGLNVALGQQGATDRILDDQSRPRRGRVRRGRVRSIIAASGPEHEHQDNHQAFHDRTLPIRRARMPVGSSPTGVGVTSGLMADRTQEQNLALVGGIAALVITAVLAFSPVTRGETDCGSVVIPKTVTTMRPPAPMYVGGVLVPPNPDGIATLIRHENFYCANARNDRLWPETLVAGVVGLGALAYFVAPDKFATKKPGT